MPILDRYPHSVIYILQHLRTLWHRHCDWRLPLLRGGGQQWISASPTVMGLESGLSLLYKWKWVKTDDPWIHRDKALMLYIFCVEIVWAWVEIFCMEYEPTWRVNQLYELSFHIVNQFVTLCCLRGAVSVKDHGSWEDNWSLKTFTTCYDLLWLPCCTETLIFSSTTWSVKRFLYCKPYFDGLPSCIWRVIAVVIPLNIHDCVDGAVNESVECDFPLIFVKTSVEYLSVLTDV